MKRAVLAMLALMAAACTPAEQTQRDLDRIASDYQRQSASDQQQRQEQTDTCGMAQHQDLIGKTQAEIQLPENARAICFGCMATMDYSPTRLTLQIGPDHKVASMRCG